jgi:hypothetical protein
MIHTIRKKFIDWSHLPTLVNRLYLPKLNTNKNNIFELNINKNDYNLYATGNISYYNIGLEKSNIMIYSNIEIKYLLHKHYYMINEKCEYDYIIDRLKLKYSLDFIKSPKGSYNDYQNNINFSLIINKDDKLINYFWLMLPDKTQTKLNSIKSLIDENNKMIKIK